MIPDYVNASFETVGAWMCWTNFSRLLRDREVKGVYWPTTAFYVVWGLWNMFYYPSLGQWWSFLAGAVLTGGNVAWVGTYLWMTRRRPKG